MSELPVSEGELEREAPLRIEKSVYGGSGLARDGSGRAVLVPFTLAGELVRITQAPARLMSDVHILEPSPHRVSPRCVHFGVCGGCQYQHASYGGQLAMKRAILAETLERAGVGPVPLITVHAAEAWGYRNRIRLQMREVEGKLRLGYYGRESILFLPVVECPIAAPLLLRAAEALLEVAGESAEAERWMRETTEIELFAAPRISGPEVLDPEVLGPEEQRLQISLFVRKGLRDVRSDGFARMCERLQARVPELVGAGAYEAVRLPGNRGGSGQPRAVAAWGRDGLLYPVGDRSYWVSRGGFFQVNRFLLGELVRLVAEGREGALAWDLYAGVGLFSRRLRETFAEVVAVEAGEVAAGDLLRTAKSAKVGAVRATTAEFLRRAVLDRPRPDLVVVDPPRAGLGSEVCALLGRIGAPEIVYVSCDPTSLGRDLREMVDSGYNLAELHLVDLFPQTFHMETVAVLRRF